MNQVSLGFVPFRTANVYGNALESALSLAPNSIANLPSDAIPTNGADAMLVQCWANTPFTVNAAAGKIKLYLIWVGPGKGDSTGICPRASLVDYRVQFLTELTFTFNNNCIANGATGLNIPDSNRLAVSFTYGSSGTGGMYLSGGMIRHGGVTVPNNWTTATVGSSAGCQPIAPFVGLMGATHIVARFTNFTSVDGAPSTDNYGAEYMFLRLSPIA